MIRQIAGLEHAEILRYGYAITTSFRPSTVIVAGTKQVVGLSRLIGQRHDRL